MSFLEQEYFLNVSQIPTTDNDLNVEGYVYTDEVNNDSAIDAFYKSTKPIIIEVNNNKVKYDESSWLGCFTVLAIISATENYIREIFKDIILICPIAQSKIKDEHKVRLSSVLWNTNSDMIRALFEDVSFSNSNTIREKLNKILGVTSLSGRTYANLFKSFDLVCNLRHGIIHADRVIAGKNAVDISLSKKESRAFLKICSSDVNSILSICTNLVLTINGVLFCEMLERWKEGWRRNDTINTWTPISDDEEKSMLSKVYDIFLSKEDYNNNLINTEHKLTVEQLYGKIKEQLS
ncbi:hypothetical protein GWI76_10460 [Proteus sp. G2659]|uniref:hypothetical protein n=1 Tax=Proteus sp. G2659 TaxID=2698872 RepID=UPI00137654D7|nr:hypothetical protein [Proteus sp. G2659]NBM79676.1 hypothetical protein [Proteus sp. G2659]